MEAVELLRLNDTRKGPSRCTRPLSASASQPSLLSTASPWDRARSMYAPPSRVASGPSARLLQATQSVGAYESFGTYGERWSIAASGPPPLLPLGRYEIIPRRGLDSRLRAREHESSGPLRPQRLRQPIDHLRFASLEAGPRRRVLPAEEERTKEGDDHWATARHASTTTAAANPVATNPFMRPELRSKRRQWRSSTSKDLLSSSSSPTRHGAANADSTASADSAASATSAAVAASAASATSAAFAASAASAASATSSATSSLLGRSTRPTREQVPPGWSVPLGFRKAADQFDEQHEFRAASAQQTLGKVCGGVSASGESAAHAEKFRAELTIVRRGRLRLPEREVKKKEGMSWRRKKELREEAKVPREGPPPWSLGRSIWAPRAKYADSKSLWDTDEVELQRFESDWRHCLVMNLAKTILKLDDGADEEEDDSFKKDDDSFKSQEQKGEEQASDEVEDVKEVLWEYHDLLAQLFVHYAASGSDMHGIELNNWSDFTDDFKLVDRKSVACKRGDFDRLFLASNSKGDRVRREILKKQKTDSPGQKKAIDRASLMKRQRTVSLGGMGGRKGALNRVEFYVSLVSIACNKVCLCSRRLALMAPSHVLRPCPSFRLILLIMLITCAPVRLCACTCPLPSLLSLRRQYVVSGEMPDVSEAVYRLLSVDILSRAARVLGSVADVNNFRTRFCYLQSVDEALRRHEQSLRVIFRATTGRGPGKDSSLLSIQEWQTFLRALDLIDADLSERDATFSFAWSRMVVADIGTQRGRLAEYNLYFEDWLEALVRISILKALPFDHEIEEAARSHPEVTHAGIYFQNLVLEDEASYNALLLERATPWGGEPSQPIARCVEHLLAIIIFKMEDDTAGKDNLVITEAEVERWCDMHNLW